MAVMRWDPFADFDRMLELVSGRAGTSGQPGTRSMPMDVYRVGDEYVVEMDLPGVDPSSIDISVDRNMLTVEAEAHSTHEQVDEQILCERRHVRYRRQLYLGENVDTERVQASYENGVLRLRIPIAQQQRARKVEIRTTSSGNPQIETQSGGQQVPVSDQQAQPSGEQPQQKEPQPAGQATS